MEKKKFRLSIVQFLLIIFCTILISVMISVGILYIVNSSTKSSKKNLETIKKDGIEEEYI